MARVRLFFKRKGLRSEESIVKKERDWLGENVEYGRYWGEYRDWIEGVGRCRITRRDPIGLIIAGLISSSLFGGANAQVMNYKNYQQPVFDDEQDF